MPRTRVDVVVVGLGVMGAAVTAALARQGLKTVGLDQYTPPHDRGSSHGQTRLLRTAYVEGDVYIPLVKRAIEGWRSLEAETGEAFFHQTGIVYLGGPKSTLLDDLDAAATAHHLPVTCLNINNLYKDNYDHVPKGFALPPGWQGRLERDAGFVRCEPAVGAFHQVAQNAGARLVFGQTVNVEEQPGKSFHIQTTSEDFEARHIILCVGPWFGQFMVAHFPRLSPIPTVLEQRTLHWYGAGPAQTVEAGFNPFCIDLDEGGWLYGFPCLDGRVKVSNHHLGARVESPEANPQALLAEHQRRMARWVAQYLPGLGTEQLARTCLYTTSPDTDFILGPHPENPRLILATGFSGHGFKFAPVIGDMLADVLMNDTADIIPAALRPDRFFRGHEHIC
ncbi:MAG: N-methyl-L-tryptophan oxidase [Pseudomonadota bacterium]